MGEVTKNHSTKKGLKSPHINGRLTPAEEEVLNLITEQFLTIEQISLRRQCTKQAVYKILKKLKEKGVINKGLQKVENYQSSKVENDKRLHGQEWNIKILWQDDRYQKSYLKSNIRFIDSHTVRLYRNSIEVYAGEGISFWGETEQRATAISLKYWDKFFHKLSHLLNIIIIKPRSENIKLVNHHYGNINSDFVKDCKDNKERIRIYAKEDGKLWFDMDESHLLSEREHPHPETGKQDSELISKHLNDIRNNNPPTNSELAVHISNITNVMGMYAENMVSHVKAIQELSNGVRELNKLVGNVIQENKKLKLGNQKSLFDY